VRLLVAALAFGLAACLAGCTPPSAPAAPCNSDEECLSGDICREGFCVAGARTDGGALPIDAGTPPVDAGQPPGDAGPPPGDAGSSPVDAGDAGEDPVLDAGEDPEQDAGAVVDAGVEVDAGDLDAGVEVDGGVDVDAGLLYPWWDPDWPVRHRVDITHADAPLSDFPAFLYLAPLEQLATGSADGSDIRFVTGGGDVLPHEVERWNGFNADVWVKLPTLAADQVVFLYSDNDSAVGAEDTDTLWSGYRSVWHLHNDLEDAAALGWDGAAVGTPAYAPGVTGRGLDLDGASCSDLGADLPHVQDVAAVTLSIWVRPDSLTGSSFFSFSANAPAGAFQSRVGFELDGDGTVRLVIRDVDDPTSKSATTTTPITAGEWTWLVGIVEPADNVVRIYFDGVEQELTRNNPLTAERFPDTPSLRGSIGADDASDGYFFPGELDEARLAAGAASPAWITAQYRSMMRQVLSLGARETYP
jgi:hypothetical protein